MKSMKIRNMQITRILIRTLVRFNPVSKPVIPASLTIYCCALIFSFLFVIQWIQHNFIKDYGKLALSAWCFVFLMNFLEAAGEIWKGQQEQ
jgi:hypothetical protein